MHKAQSKHQKSVVKYIVSPENTISIRVDENTKVENDSDEENRDVVNEEETELLSDWILKFYIIIYNKNKKTRRIIKNQFAIDREERTCIVQVNQRIDWQ